MGRSGSCALGEAALRTFRRQAGRSSTWEKATMTEFSVEAATIRVAIVEDQPAIREGLSALIGATDGFSCSGCFGSMEEALRAIDTEPPDVALIDIGLPGISGIEGIRLLKQRHPGLALLVLSVYDEDQRIFDALCAGASGYLVKTTVPARLIEALRETVAGGAPMSPEVARRVLELFRRAAPAAAAAGSLTAQEERILEMLAEGHNYSTAAAESGLGVSAVSSSMKRVYEKLQARVGS